MVGLEDSVFELSWPALLPGSAPTTATDVNWAVLTEQPDRLPAGLRAGPIHTELTEVTPTPNC